LTSDEEWDTTLMAKVQGHEILNVITPSHSVEQAFCLSSLESSYFMSVTVNTLRIKHQAAAMLPCHRVMKFCKSFCILPSSFYFIWLFLE
jgi:hypothetical protein